ncbi:MAG TPA: cytochrome c oxidase assembly protein [Ktedonobacteraceae bacterium]|jgi:putative membrane protein|nr:cytochrome c oxidase assembly protein [Ktedonobacteraceae bacterium]
MFGVPLTQWSINIWGGGFLVLLCVLYGLALLSARRRGAHAPLLRIVSFLAGIVIAALLLFSPLETIGRTQLFFIHMMQVVALTTVCTPLILAGFTEDLVRPLVDAPVARAIALKLTSPLLASVIFNLFFLLWHTPRLFTFAQSSASAYDLMMVTIFASSFLNWHPLIGSIQEARHMSYPMQMLYAFFDGQPVDILAFVLVFTQVSLYTFPAHVGLSTFSDQATGGAVLLVPGIVDLIVMTPLFFRWLGQIESHTRLADQQRQQALDEEEWEDDDDDEDEWEEAAYVNEQIQQA